MENQHLQSEVITKKDIVFVLFLALLVGAFIGVLSYRDQNNNYQQGLLKQRVERMNAHIKYLHDEEGYSWEAARKIGTTEAGFIPADSEYKALKED